MAVSRTRGRERDTATAPPSSDAYTGMLAISLVAMIIASILLFLDYNQYPKKKPDAPPAPSGVRAPANQPVPASVPQAGTPAPGTVPAPAPGAPATPPM